MNALGVSQYGQMTAGSYMYIGPQGIVHGTTITVLNACRMIKSSPGTKGKLFVTAGLGGMSGAQPKAGNIAGVVTICAEVNATAAHKRHSQGWVDEVITDVDACIDAALEWQKKGEAHSIAFLGNVVDLWERLAARNIKVDLGSDQTRLYYLEVKRSGNTFQLLTVQKNCIRPPGKNSFDESITMLDV